MARLFTSLNTWSICKFFQSISEFRLWAINNIILPIFLLFCLGRKVPSAKLSELEYYSSASSFEEEFDPEELLSTRYVPFSEEVVSLNGTNMDSRKLEELTEQVELLEDYVSDADIGYPSRD